jgi:hypothetical protein
MRDAALRTDVWVKEADLSPNKWLSTWFDIEEAA